MHNQKYLLFFKFEIRQENLYTFFLFISGRIIEIKIFISKENSIFKFKKLNIETIENKRYFYNI